MQTPSYSRLLDSEREEISIGIASGKKLCEIAQSLGRHPSTISREVRRNGGVDGYRAGLSPVH